MIPTPLVLVGRAQCRIVTAEVLQHIGDPAPILKHHARHFDKVIVEPADPVEPRVLGFGNEVVNCMTQFCTIYVSQTR